MKKLLGIVLVCFLAVSFVSLALAEEKENCMKGKMKGEMKGKMNQSMGMVHPMMLGKTLVATSDGGVVVMIGNMLYKYDKNLTLQKETEIKIDMEAMKKSMQEMMKKCPMMNKEMTSKMEMKASEEPQAKVEAAQ